MPTYVYRCTRCSTTTEERRAIADREVAATCPACGAPARLTIAAPASSFPGSDRWRTVQKSRGRDDL